MKWIKRSKAYKEYLKDIITPQNFQHYFKKDPIFKKDNVVQKEKGKNSYKINVESDEFIVFVKKHGEKNNISVDKLATKIEKNVDTSTSMKGFITESDAEQARWKAQIHEADIKRIKAESEKIELQKKRAVLIDRRLAEYLYLSFISKITMEIFRAKNKIDKKLKEFLRNKLETEDLHEFSILFKKLYDNEIEVLIKTNKDLQKEQVKKWKP